MGMDDGTVAAATRLAALLADGHGAELLAQMQKLTHQPGREDAGPSLPFGVSAGNAGQVGVWRPERVDDGIALRRDPSNLDWMLWSNTDYLPACGDARRVVLVGESAARGWLLDPVFTPADVLRRQLETAAPGRYQVVDLARSAADLDTLAQVVRSLPLIEPDVVVLFAGNNFSFPPLDDSYRDLLAAALREGGYRAMRQCFVDAVVRPRVAAFLEQLAVLQRQHGMTVVIVVPESNLRGWVPAPDVESLTLPSDALPLWYSTCRDATAALEQARWDDARAHAVHLSTMDDGAGPAAWYLRGRAEEALGNGAAARALLETARDTVCGLLVEHVNSIITDVRRLQIDFAERNGIRWIDLSTALASADLPDLPDSRFFLDNCHLTDDAIERAMSLVADAVLDLPAGTTSPGDGAPPAARAVAHALAAAYCAYRNQPADTVRAQLRSALDADAEAATRFLNAFLDLLETAGPKWTHPALMNLFVETPQAFMLCLQMAQTRHHSVGFWTLREVVHEVLGRHPVRGRGGWAMRDLLALPDGRGFRTPSFAPAKAYFEATAQRTKLAFALDGPVSGVLRLTYRMPTGDDQAMVELNGEQIGRLPAAARWSTVTLDVPAEACRDGVNWIVVRWPMPVSDAHAQLAEDASALARRLFPRVLPVFGALFTAFFSVAARGDVPRMAAFASRSDYSTGWTPERTTPVAG